MSIRDPQWLNRPALLNYGAAVLSVVVAFFLARVLQTQYDFEPLVPFICAMIFSAWIGGVGPGVLAVALSLLAFHYYFLLPIYASGMDKEMPRLLVAAGASLAIVWVSAAQRSAKNALRESELRLRQIAENIRGVFWMTTPDMKELLYVSPAYGSIWGRTQESLHRLPRSFMEVIHPEDRDYACKILNGQRGQGFDLEYRIVRPDGAVRWIHDRGVPVKDESGAVYRIAGIAEDITEQKEAADALRRSERNLHEREELYRVLADNANELIRIHDVDGRSIYASPSVKRLFGQDPASIFEFVHPADLEGGQQWWKHVLAGSQERLFLRVRDRDGAWHWMETQASLVEHEGQRRVMTICRDVTARRKAEEALRESEQRFRRLIEMMPVAVYVCDTSGIITSYNRRAVELWGREPQLGHSAQRYCGSLHLYSTEGELIPHAESKMAEVLRTGVQARDLEVVIERPDGSRITVLVNIVPLRGDDGELMGAMNCFLDITERKRVENALRDAASQLEALSRRLVALQESERKELARELHDRIGQSLTALNINLNILSTSLPPQASKELRIRLADSEALVESTTAAIGNVMSDLRPPMLDDQGLVPALNWYAKQFSARTGVAVEVRSGEADERPAPDTEIALFRVAQEALNNVVKHARASRVEITLARSGTGHMMSVQDNGMGIDVAKRASPRPGLGLITMRERAQAVGGVLEVRAVPGNGTRLTVKVAA